MAEENSILAGAVGGLIGIVGGIITQVAAALIARSDKRHERDKRQRERLEKIADLVSETLPWFMTFGDCRDIMSAVKMAPPMEARKALTLATLYFPRLQTPIADYSNSIVLYYQACLKCCRGGVDGTLGGMVVAMARENPQLQKIIEEPGLRRQAVDDALAKEGSRYAHA